MNTDQLLPTLDPATGPTDEQRRRADALLERVVTEPLEPMPKRGRRVIAWRAAGILAAGAVVAAVALAVPGLASDGAAVASWTPEAEPVSAADLAVAEAACRAQLVYSRGASDIPLTLSERRGQVVALLFYRENPETASSCVLDLPEGATAPRDITSGSGGSSGRAMIPLAGGFVESALASYTLGGQALSVVTGSVGPEVASITVRAGGEEATATISDGHYAAWMPGSVFTVSDAPSGEGGPEPTTTYDLQLVDGTVVRDVTSTFP